MGLVGKILIGIIILMILAIVVGVVLYKNVTSSPTVNAQINVESGQVLVNGAPVYGDKNLKKGDVVETGADGEATVILYESVLVSLEPNTKITLEDLTKQHPQITQEKGETWNKFTKLSGVEEYSVKTGNSVASVRGTAFGISKDKIIVGEGDVDYRTNGDSFDVRENEVVDIENGKRIKRIANAEEREKIKGHFKRIIKRMRHLRDLEMNKNKFLVNKLKAAKGWTDEDVKTFLENADEGKVNLDELIKESPIDAEGLRKVANQTREIRKAIEKLRILKANQ